LRCAGRGRWAEMKLFRPVCSWISNEQTRKMRFKIRERGFAK
jgi:hypothetical protein